MEVRCGSVSYSFIDGKGICTSKNGDNSCYEYTYSTGPLNDGSRCLIVYYKIILDNYETSGVIFPIIITSEGSCIHLGHIQIPFKNNRCLIAREIRISPYQKSSIIKVKINNSDIFDQKEKLNINVAPRSGFSFPPISCDIILSK